MRELLGGEFARTFVMSGSLSVTTWNVTSVSLALLSAPGMSGGRIRRAAG